MDLILWRHADAEDGADDLARRLTAKGHQQAAARPERQSRAIESETAEDFMAGRNRRAGRGCAAYPATPGPVATLV